MLYYCWVDRPAVLHIGDAAVDVVAEADAFQFQPMMLMMMNEFETKQYGCHAPLVKKKIIGENEKKTCPFFSLVANNS